MRHELAKADVPFIERSYAGRRLKQIILHLNGTCNCACKHCYIGPDTSTALPLRTIASLLEQAASIGVQRVSITGGEPFLREDLDAIVQMLPPLGLRLYPVFTNATLLRKRLPVVSLITQLYDTAFYVSLHGLEGSHDAFVGRAGAFDAVVDGIRILKKLRAQVAVNTSLHKQNVGEMPEMFEFLKRLQIERWRVSRPFQSGRWLKEHSKWQITHGEEALVFNDLLRMYRIQRPLDLELGRLFKSVEGAVVKQSYEPSDLICGYFEHYAVVWPDGEVSPCPKLAASPFLFGNVRTTRLRTIWESSAMESWKRTTIEAVVRRGKTCKNCSLVNRCISAFGRGCPANSFLAGESLCGPDIDLCETIRQSTSECVA